MTTLRDLWIELDLTSAEVADRARITKPTLYKMNRKEKVSDRTIVRVCRILGITRAQYHELEVCPMADRYRQP